MFNVVSSAAIGFFAKASCDLVPKVSWRSSSFKLSFCISSFVPPQLAQDVNGQRPFVTITTSEKKKKTELGTWSQEQGEWQFRETITVEVSPEDEITIQVSFANQYDLVLAAVELSSTLIGEVCFPVSSVLPKLIAYDRDLDGLVHATPAMGFDLSNKGARNGRIYVSMETRSKPVQKGNGFSIADTCINAKAISDKDRSKELTVGHGPECREQMYADRYSGPTYADRQSDRAKISDEYRQSQYYAQSPWA